MIVGVEVTHLLISTVLLSIGIGYCQMKKNIKNHARACNRKLNLRKLKNETYWYLHVQPQMQNTSLIGFNKVIDVF